MHPSKYKKQAGTNCFYSRCAKIENHAIINPP